MKGRPTAPDATFVPCGDRPWRHVLDVVATLGRRTCGLLLTIALTAAVGGCGGADTPDAAQPVSPSPSTTTVEPTPSAPTTSPPTTSPPATSTSSPSASDEPAADPPRLLRPGDTGPDVSALQGRLAELGYWVGHVDGRFGDSTEHAVIALQKTAGLARDGVVGPATRGALDTGSWPPARSHTGLVVEIDLDRQLLLIVREGLVELVLDTSTGSRPATTPVGHWQVTREIDGLRQSELGLLYRPKYFYGGVAIHGYPSVPPYPASHGCVRLTYPAMDHVWATGLMSIGTPVWVY